MAFHFFKIEAQMSNDQSITHIRPRFRFTLSLSEKEVHQRISQQKDKDDYLIVRTEGDQYKLDIPIKDRHYWTPQMSFRVEKDWDDPAKTEVRGLIGPRPAVWTMFTLIYLAIGTLGFSLSFWGLSKWMLGEFSQWVWAFPISLLIMLTAYRAGKYGEKLGHDQMEVLKDFLRASLPLD